MAKEYTQISQLERDQISLLRSQGFTFSEIGSKLGRSGSSISREYRRNRDKGQAYLPSVAHEKAKARNVAAAEVSSKCEPHEHEIYRLLCLGWAPAQIASWLRKMISGFSISYETIYCFIYKYRIQWAKLLPRKHEPRWTKGMCKAGSKREMIPNRTGIAERSEAINDKSEFGHWEGDSIVCSQSVVSLNVMAERQTQYVSIRKVSNRGPGETRDAMIASLRRFKRRGRKSVTLDNGIEFKWHEEVQAALKIDTYFCQPYHSWEKGLVEQVNGLIRRFLPKKTDLSEVTEKEIRLIEYLLNSRPRKLLKWKTPAEVFAKKCRMKLVDGALAT